MYACRLEDQEMGQSISYKYQKCVEVPNLHNFSNLVGKKTTSEDKTLRIKLTIKFGLKEFKRKNTPSIVIYDISKPEESLVKPWFQILTH